MRSIQSTSQKSERLVRSVQEIQQFAIDRIEYDERFRAVSQALEGSVSSLQAGRLTLQIIGQNPVSIQAFQNLLSRCKSLAEFYYFRTAVLPDESPPVLTRSPANLSLQDTCGGQQHHELSTTQKRVIGRHPESQISIPNHYVLVSGYHAEVQPIANSSSDKSRVSWQICDFSRNGTYINGQRVQACQPLQAGDRITLGSSTASHESPELIFESPSDLAVEHNESKILLTDCDVLCLVTDLRQTLITGEKQFLEEASKAQIVKLIVIAVMPESASETSQEIVTHLAEIQAWLQSQAHASDSELVPLLPFYPDESKTDSGSCQELDRLCQSLAALVKRRPEEILAKRVTTQILAQLNSIEDLLEAQENALELEQRRADSPDIGQVQSKEALDKLLKQLNEDKGSFFRQARENLKQSKVDFLDEYLENSITCKLRSFVDRLKPRVTKRDGRKYIHLEFSVPPTSEQNRLKHKKLKPGIEDKTIDANTALMHFCRSNLSLWATQEWNRLCTTYVRNGLIGLFQRAYETLSSVPALKLSGLDHSLFQINYIVDSQSIFQEAIAIPSCVSRYQEVSPISYILKTIRGQWMQFIFMFSLFSILGIAGRRQIMQHLTQPIVSAFKSSPWISTLVLASLLYFLLKFLIHLYQEHRDTAREKEAEKLRNNLRSYYQSLVKNRLIEKLVHHLNLTLDIEEQKIEAILHLTKQYYVEQNLTGEVNQLSIRERSDKYNALKRELKNDREKLQKLKRTLTKG